MTVYYTLTFFLMVAEMATFCLLVLPLPFAVRKKMFKFLNENVLVAKLAYGLKIAFIFVGILFVDAVQRMLRLQGDGQGEGTRDVRTETNVAARKFYAQRNMYLTGFTLFLSIILTRTFFILLDLVHIEEEYSKLKKATANNSKSAIVSQEQTKQIDELKARIAALQSKERDFDTLKKQADQQAAEYNRLADKYNEATGQISDKRVD
ncbi:B-cell receptor-associated protein 31-like-domain-containing protein [Cantharellus anzutake]|uniref:B-cell receptor-associated protein 31-like-domain-containing protein n=1 Tax=Cantharellus anzutake TaxID=1750568 RepID=UPI00190601B1|nr:B-cell receptor-associated protein 31-like-domain-containing protein [Cantharellus anzutake]KAF8332007.1 B-cell receptor-associated protein 31-like-domain-containing protein [Cantharellus anzutake]